MRLPCDYTHTASEWRDCVNIVTISASTEAKIYRVETCEDEGGPISTRCFGYYDSLEEAEAEFNRIAKDNGYDVELWRGERR